MQQDGYAISYEEVYQQLPHAYWEATNIGHITSDDQYMEYAREELKDILLGKKAYDINQVTYTVEGSYETRDFTPNFKNTWQAFQKSKKKSANTAMGLAVEELVGEELAIVTVPITASVEKIDFVIPTVKPVTKHFGLNASLIIILIISSIKQ